MPTFMIRRVTGPTTSEDRDASAFRAISCAIYFPGLKWIESFVDEARGEIHCIYDATDEEQIREHARRSGLPCDEVRQVVTVDPGKYQIV